MTTLSKRTESQDLVRGGVMLAGAMAVANAGNYVVNVGLGRWLSPAEFADANLMVTVFLLVTAFAIGLQFVAAKATDDAAVAWLRRRARIAGALLAVVLGAGAPFWKSVFACSSAWPFVVLALGMPCYLTQAVGRGFLQGHLDLRRLSWSFVVEMVVRVIMTLGLVAAGFGVLGATFGLVGALFATWLTVRQLTRSMDKSSEIPVDIAAVLRASRLMGVLLIGQIIVNNGDALMAKHTLPANTAAIYAAIALVGRAVFFLSWSVATTIYPAAARRHASGGSSQSLLLGAVGAVFAIGLSCSLAAWCVGSYALGKVFGPLYSGHANHLALYAGATTMFAVSNLIATHEVSIGRGRDARLIVAGGVVQTVLLLALRNSIGQLIAAQLLAMGGLTLVLGALHLRPQRVSTFNLVSAVSR